MNNVVPVRIMRFDPDTDTVPGYKTYNVPTVPGMTVLHALYQIVERQDGSLSFRAACRSGVCGSCAMNINGANRLACETQIGALRGPITVKPLPHLPLIKDLVVDMASFFENYERIRPYLITLNEPPVKERLQSPEDRKKLDNYIDCILCACCTSACTSTAGNPNTYLGPAALTKAYRFIVDSRDEAQAERLRLVATEDGIFRCHTIFNCTEDCPKGISPTVAIQEIKKMILGRALTGRL